MFAIVLSSSGLFAHAPSPMFSSFEEAFVWTPLLLRGLGGVVSLCGEQNIAQHYSWCLSCLSVSAQHHKSRHTEAVKADDTVVSLDGTKEAMSR